MLLLNFFVTNAQHSISIHSGMSCVSLMMLQLYMEEVYAFRESIVLMWIFVI